MIALRGKLERAKKEPAEGPPPGEPVSDQKQEGEEAEEWIWKGHWAFGATLPEDEKKWQRFIYKWEIPVPPSEVVVISLNNAAEAEEEEDEEEADKQSTDMKEETEKKDPDVSNPAEKESRAGGGTIESTEIPKDQSQESKTKVDEKATNFSSGEGNEESKSTKKTTPLVDSNKEGDGEKKPETTDNSVPISTTEPGPSDKKLEQEKTEKYSPDDPPKSKTESESNKRQKITFATPLSPDDPPFTDASEKYPDKCPAGGRWKGYFENAIKPLKRKNNSAPPTIQKIEETFHIYLNATPRKEAQTWFATDDIATSTKKKKTTAEIAKEEALGVLQEGLIHVRGTGENQFGNFELLGSFDVETGVLECQRMYVAEAVAPPVRRRSSSRGGSDGTKLNSDGRPYYTRKKQMSWKRRSSFGTGGSDSDGDGTAGTGRRRGSFATGASAAAGGKRVRVADPKTATPEGGAAGNPTKATVSAASAQLSIAVPPPTTTIGTKRPGPSPKAAGTPRAKKANTGSGNNTPASARDKSVTPSSSTTSMFMKVPPVGDPKMAVWRAAHYLYYQKNDPSQEEGGTGGSTNSGSSNAAGNAYKYVVYEGEMSKSQREGRGLCLFSNQMLYEGEWKRNKEHGRGTLMTADRKRVIYDGEWERGRMHGKGTYYYSAGVVMNSKQQVVISDEVKGKKKGSSTAGSGQGADSIESRYEGDFKENLRHGYGKYVLPDGSSYEGMWRENMMCGRGVFNWADGSFYDGEWKEGRRHGIGILRVSDGFSYEGSWAQNAMEGRGTATYPNGQTYNGLFSNGRREGRGTIHFTNGAIYEGRFRDDAIDGQGTMKMSKLIIVPRETKTDMEESKASEEVDAGSHDNIPASDEGEKTGDDAGEAKPDFMIPLSFQSDMGHIHQKAGFTLVGE